jgi:hypothetical protein
MSGFSRLSDSLWHAGISNNMPIILKDVMIPFTWYAEAFPASFIFNYAGIVFTGTSIPTYATILFPCLYISIFIVLWYTVIGRLCDDRIAFLSTLIFIPGLHYLEIHPSPRAIGTFFVVLGLILLIRFTETRKMTDFILVGGIFALLIFTHIIFTMIFLALIMAFIISKLITRRGEFLRQIKKFKWKLILSLIIITSLVILTMILFSDYFESGVKLVQAIISDIGSSFDGFIQTLLGRTIYIYPWIPLLHILVVYTYIIILLILLGFLYLAYRQDLTKRIRDLFHLLGSNGLFFLISMIMIAGFVFFISLAGDTTESLRERGLFFFIPIAASLICHLSLLIKRKWKTKYKKLLISMIAWLLIISLLYPIIAYHGESYASYPQSENEGMKFLTKHVELNGTRISMLHVTQLSSYIDSSVSIIVIGGFPPEIDKENFDIVVFRRTSFFYIAMNEDLSFEKNGLIDAKMEVDSNSDFDKVYSSKSIELYLNNK